jgi:protein TonB
MRLFIIFCLFISSQGLFSQQEEVLTEIPFAVIEKVPVYPGCTDETNAGLKKCMSQQISAIVGKNFNVKKGSKNLNAGTYRVFVNFKIDTNGNVTDIKSRAPNAKLEKEAIRVIKKLPRMIPGQQKGKNVGVLYSLPITFKIEPKKK